jgi:tRNA(Arg) A34 adenosine deaminase TadA
MVALRQRGGKLEDNRMTETTLFVTLEPCVMCAGAIIHARVARVVYATADPKTGAAGSVFDLLTSERHNHCPAVSPGLLADEAGDRLREFFRRRR